MEVFFADLHEHAAVVRQKFLRGNEAVSEVTQVAVDAEVPSVAERLHHLRFSGEVLFLVLHVALANFRLEVAGELDAVGRVDVDYLHFAGEVFALGEARHHLKRIAEDEPVPPVHLVLVELDRLLILQFRIAE